jgi:hypothetical protein
MGVNGVILSLPAGATVQAAVIIGNGTQTVGVSGNVGFWITYFYGHWIAPP